MPPRRHKNKEVPPDWQEIARKAAIWAASPAGQAATDQAVKYAKEAVAPLNEALRLGTERLQDDKTIFSNQP